MTLENLDAHLCYGRYDHYLKSGQRERRMGQFLFDGMFYRAGAIEAGIDPEEIDAAGPYVHFLNRLGSGQEELAPSIYFDPFWYVEHHPGAKAEIARGRYTSAIHHYLNSDVPQHLDPVPQFSEAFYRRRHPDIAAAVEQGLYRSAYQQFVQYGAFELRQPAAGIDLAYYRDMHERVRNDLNSGEIRDAFAHLRLVGLRRKSGVLPAGCEACDQRGGDAGAISEKGTASSGVVRPEETGFFLRHGAGPVGCRRAVQPV